MTGTTDLKRAARLAEQYFAEIYEGQEFQNLRLEEVEWKEDDGAWLITLGFDLPARASMSNILGVPNRGFKTFEIDAQTGTLRAMKIRHPDHA